MIIHTSGLTKRFRSLTAVDQIDLAVAHGDIYGFLGANGSGKTTTVRMLVGLVLATSGQIRLLGHPMPKAAHRVLPDVGSLIEGPAAYEHLTGRKNLMLHDALGRLGPSRTRLVRVDDALARVGLDGALSRPVKAYSMGMRQRLGLALALLGDPALLILDEPTNGLDPQGIHEIRSLLQELNRRGTTIFMSSHLLAEVEQLCTRVGVIDRGRLILQDDLANLTRPTGRVIVSTPDVDAALGVLGGRARVIGRERIVVDDRDSAAVNARLVTHGVRVVELAPERRNLESVVLGITAASSPGARPQ